MKNTILLVALSAATGLPALVQANGYPNKPITLVVPYAAGGGTDTAARIIAKKLAGKLKQPVVVENKAGGATQIGTSYVVRAKPDGYTLLMGTANLATNPAFYKTLPYNVKTDLTPVVLATDVPVYIFTSPNASVKKVQDIRTQSKQGRALSYATAGVGSIPHMAAEIFNRKTGLHLQHVPYKGSAEAVVAAAGNQVPLSFDNLAPAYGQVKAGRLVPLAIAADKRSPALPDIPTLKELGIPVVAASWWGVLAPAGTPPAVIRKLNTQINDVVKDKSVQDFLLQQGIHTVGGTPEQFTRYIHEESEKWQAIVREADLHLEN
ncbi:MAG: Bug family tripartite tricarboxylate transporter substrate binding protein [Advenella sp.]|uniref:Tripartite tricarboxylate transporter substrate binding protein n=1 Tax=Advenella kashmirensis TaxID=310575 RepID=A0A356LHD8_9BURK|nr:tripartite tricarboxylate transporter substrate binding protein [Advenella kashmirensis]